MKQTILLIILFTLSVNYSSAQEKIARKLFDFGVISCDQMTERVAMLNDALEDEPTAKAYIIYYNGFYFQPKKTGQVKKNILVDRRAYGFAWNISNQIKFYKKLDQTKVEVIYGGYQDRVLFEVWLVPEGANPPIPNSTVNIHDKKFKNIKVIRKPIPCRM